MIKFNKTKTIGLLSLLSVFSILLIASQPTQACACGMLAPEIGKEIMMKRERGLVIFDSKANKEQLIIDFQLDGSSPKTALIVPTPVKAKIGQIKRETLDDAEYLLNPRYEMLKSMDSINSTAPGDVEVLERKIVGNFDIAALKTNSFGSLYKWANDNGFEIKPEAENTVRSFIDSEFVLNIIKLKKDADTSDINPLKFSFETSSLFYPIMQVKDDKDDEKDKSLNLYIFSDIKLSFKDTVTSNEEMYSYDLKDSIYTATEDDFSNLHFENDKYYATYIKSSDYGDDEELISALGNPEMKVYNDSEIEKTEDSPIWAYIVIIIETIIIIAGVAYIIIDKIISNRKNLDKKTNDTDREIIDNI